MAEKTAEKPAKSNPVRASKVSPKIGSVTWGSEGTEGGRHHSRKLHVPSETSGLTIGRGYDLKKRRAGDIVGDLMKAGVSKADAETIAKAAGLHGKAARKFIVDNHLEEFEISEEAQVALFDTAYEEIEADTRRLATKQDVVAAYGATIWKTLDPAIKEMLIDLRFRGDYDGTARAKIQKYVSANDLEGFAKVLADSDNWKNVPADRFKQRRKFVEQAVKAKKKAQSAQTGLTAAATKKPHLHPGKR